ncbi:hypothetical protein bcgnr5380_59030 [Bacillus cereus]
MVPSGRSHTAEAGVRSAPLRHGATDTWVRGTFVATSALRS